MGEVRVSDLTKRFEVDASTIRRDLHALATQKAIKRVHGGAIAVQGPEEKIANEAQTAVAARIAQAVASSIGNEETVFLGPGELTLALAKKLASHSRLTVVTNGLEIAYWTAANTSHTLIVIGGQVGGYDLALGGELARRAFTSMRADKVILEYAGVSAIGGLTADSLPQAEIARILMGIGAEIIILVAPQRISRVAVAFVAPVTDADVIVTAREAPSSALWDLSEAGVRIVLA